MLCFTCRKDQPFWELFPVSHEFVGLEQNPLAKPPDPKPLLCEKCLIKWSKRRIKENKNGKSKRALPI